MKYDIKIFVESVEKIQFLLQSENNNRYCTWTPMYNYDNICL